MNVASRVVKKPRVTEQKSKSVLQIVDARAAKTRAQIRSAFVDLLGRRSYDRIRVSDITRKAGVGRVTFYAHFASKDALLAAELARVVVPMLTELPGDSCLIDGTELFAHVQHARKIYRSLTTGPTRNATERIIQDALEAQINRLLAERGGSEPQIPIFVPRFVASTLLTLIAWSLEQTAIPSPAALQDMFRLLVGRALARIT